MVPGSGTRLKARKRDIIEPRRLNLNQFSTTSTNRFGQFFAFIFSEGSKFSVVKISKCFKLHILNIFFPYIMPIFTLIDNLYKNKSKTN